MKITLTQDEREAIADMIQSLLNDEGHAISESISTEFDLADFKVEITATKMFSEEKSPHDLP